MDYTIHLPTLQCRHLYASMMQVFNVLQGFEDIDAGCFIRSDNDSDTSGHALSIRGMRCITARHLTTFFLHLVAEGNISHASVVVSTFINLSKPKLM